jgi:hypothetical protein
LATRKKDLSIDLERSGKKEPTLIEDKESDEKPIFERFSKPDQKRIIKYLKAGDDDTFTNYPVLQRGRPEKMKKNILFNRSFNGYDNDFLKKVAVTKRGKYISKEGVSSLPDVPDDENEDLLSEVTSLLSGDSASARSMLRGDSASNRSEMRGYPDIPTPDTAFMYSRLPENMKKTKKGASKKAPSVEEAMRIINPKKADDPWGELEGETFPEMPSKKSESRFAFPKATVTASSNAENWDITEQYKDGKIKTAMNRVTGEIRKW